MSGPDKPKVIGEEWSDERIRGFLDIVPYDPAINADYHVLLKAYRAMRAEDFERFIGFFVAAGRDPERGGRAGPHPAGSGLRAPPQRRIRPGSDPRPGQKEKRRPDTESGLRCQSGGG